MCYVINTQKFTCKNNLESHSKFNNQIYVLCYKHQYHHMMLFVSSNTFSCVMLKMLKNLLVKLALNLR